VTALQLRDYQLLARDFLRNQPRGAGLFLDMSLGKTAISLSALEPRHLPVLVIAPKRVAERVWIAERDKWRPDLSMALAVGDPPKRKEAVAEQADITVSSNHPSFIAELKPTYKTVIIDESSVFREKMTKRWRAARKLCVKADHVWALSGTPVPAGLLNLWSQMFLLDGGERLGTTLGGYRGRYFFPGATLPSGVVTEWILREESQGSIHAKIEGICLYMSAADELDLPPTHHNVVDVPLPAAAKSQYKEFKDTLVLDLELIGEEIYSAANAAVLSGKLRQVTSGFIYSDEQDGTYTPLHTAKLDALEEIVDGTGDNLLVFYNFRPEIDMIRERFPQAKMMDDKGALDAWDRAELPMMLAHPASVGHGLNLQFGGHTAVWFSLTWDLELYLQSNGRLPRPGQKHSVVIHSIECPGTVDKIVARALANKDFNQTSFLDHVRSPI
jgi:SNF2 family DNA or RNA helicase